jgi:hypothetical protein
MTDRRNLPGANADVTRVPGRARAVYNVAIAHNHVVGLQRGEEEQQRRQYHTGSISPAI